jgi:hypothetical protein
MFGTKATGHFDESLDFLINLLCVRIIAVKMDAFSMMIPIKVSTKVSNKVRTKDCPEKSFAKC